jgi:hypothetical protein
MKEFPMSQTSASIAIKLAHLTSAQRAGLVTLATTGTWSGAAVTRSALVSRGAVWESATTEGLLLITPAGVDVLHRLDIAEINPQVLAGQRLARGTGRALAAEPEQPVQPSWETARG